MLSRAWLLATAVAPLFVVPPALACDSTSCSFLTRDQRDVSQGGSWRFDLSFRSSSLDRGISTSADGQILAPLVDFAGGRIVPNYHVALPSSASITQLDVSYGLTDRLTVVAALPLVHRSFGYLHTIATPAPSDAESASHHVPFDPLANNIEQHFTTSGVGDLQAGASYAMRADPSKRLAGSLSLRIPTGRYHFSDPSVGIFHPDFQPGTGSLGVVAFVGYSGKKEDTGWSIAGSYTRNGRNGLQYRPGDEVLAAVGVTREMSKRLTGSFQMKVSWIARSSFVGETVPSTGATLVYFNPGLQWSLGSAVRLYGFAPIPVVSSVTGSQFVPRISVLLGASKVF